MPDRWEDVGIVGEAPDDFGRWEDVGVVGTLEPPVAPAKPPDEPSLFSRFGTSLKRTFREQTGGLDAGKSGYPLESLSPQDRYGIERHFAVNEMDPDWNAYDKAQQDTLLRHTRTQARMQTHPEEFGSPALDVAGRMFRGAMSPLIYTAKTAVAAAELGYRQLKGAVFPTPAVTGQEAWDTLKDEWKKATLISFPPVEGKPPYLQVDPKEWADELAEDLNKASGGELSGVRVPIPGYGDVDPKVFFTQIAANAVQLIPELIGSGFIPAYTSKKGFYFQPVIPPSPVKPGAKPRVRLPSPEETRQAAYAHTEKVLFEGDFGARLAENPTPTDVAIANRTAKAIYRRFGIEDQAVTYTAEDLASGKGGAGLSVTPTPVTPSGKALMAPGEAEAPPVPRKVAAEPVAPAGGEWRDVAILGEGGAGAEAPAGVAVKIPGVGQVPLGPSAPAPSPKTKEPWQMTRAEAVGETPVVPDGNTSTLKKRYGATGPTPAQAKAFRQVDAERSKALKLYKAYVEHSNAHMEAVRDAVKAGKPVPMEVLAEYPSLAPESPASTPNEPMPPAPVAPGSPDVVVAPHPETDESLFTHDASGKPLKESERTGLTKPQTDYFVKALQKAQEGAPLAADVEALKDLPPNRASTAFMDPKELASLYKEIVAVTIQVPGDGEFTVVRTAENLAEMLDTLGVKPEPNPVKAWVPFAAKENGRYAMKAVMVEKGQVTATDGRLLVRTKMDTSKLPQGMTDSATGQPMTEGSFPKTDELFALKLKPLGSISVEDLSKAVRKPAPDGGKSDVVMFGPTAISTSFAKKVAVFLKGQGEQSVQVFGGDFDKSVQFVAGNHHIIVMPRVDPSTEVSAPWTDTARAVRAMDTKSAYGKKVRVAGETQGSRARMEEASASQAVAEKTPSEAFENQSPMDQVPSRQEIIDKISKALALPIRIGHSRLFSRGIASGIFKGKTGYNVARLAKAQDVAVAAHEAFHHLDAIWKLQLRPYYAELKEIASKPLGKPTKLKIAAEGFAEWGRLYVTEPSTARAKAPEFTAFMEDFLKHEQPEIRQVMLDARAAYQRWMDSPAAAKVGSHISKGPPPDARTLAERMSSAWDRFTMKWRDGLNPYRLVVEELKSKGVDLTAGENPFLLGHLLAGTGGKANAFIENKSFTTKGIPLNEGLGPIMRRITEGRWDDFDIYLTGKHAVEVSAKGKETGISVDIARDAASQMAAKHPDFPKEAQGVHQWNRDGLRYVRDSGLMSQDSYEKIINAYAFYVPFNRVMEEAVAQGFIGGKRTANLASPVKRMKGSAREIVSPTESMYKNIHSMIDVADRNRVLLALVDAAKKHPGMGKFVERIDRPMTKAASVSLSELLGEHNPVLAEIAEAGIDPEAIMNIYRPAFDIPGANIIHVMRDGKPEFYQLSEDLYTTTMSLQESKAGDLTKVLQFFTRTLRMGVVLDPAFALRNAVRDQFSVFFQSMTGIAHPIDAVQGLASYLKEDELYWRYMMSGAAKGTLQSISREHVRTGLRDSIRDEGNALKNLPNTVVLDPGRLLIQGHPLDAGRQVVRGALDELAAWGNMIEESTRMGQFKRILDRPGTPGSDFDALVQAAYGSKEGTVNFTRIGTSMKAYAPLKAFFNPMVQGLDKFVREIHANPGRAGAKGFLLLTIPTLLLYEANKRNERYQRLPNWRKDLFWNFDMTGDDGVEKWFSMPIPYEWGLLFKTLPERMLRWRDEGPSALPSAGEIGAGVLEQAESMMLPTAIQAPVEAVTNFDIFRQRPIVPRGTQGLLPEEQISQRTSEVAKHIGGLIGVAPLKVDHVIRGETGGLGKLATEAADALLRAIGTSPQRTTERALTEYPLIRSFITEAWGSSDATNRFYEQANRIEAAYLSAKRAAESGDVAKAETFLKDYPEVAHRDSYLAMAEALGNLSRARRQVKTVLERQAIERQMHDLAAEFLKIQNP